MSSKKPKMKDLDLDALKAETGEIEDGMREPYLPRKRGAPTKLTLALQKKICEIVEVCNSLEDASLVVGVDRATVFRWTQKGREQSSGPYRDFCNAIERAKARRRTNFAMRISKHGEKKYEALAWLAERTDPKHFGLRIKVQVNEELERMMDKLAANLTPQEYERALEALSTPDDSGEAAGAPPSIEGSVGRGIAAAVGSAIDSELSKPGTPE